MEGKYPFRASLRDFPAHPHLFKECPVLLDKDFPVFSIHVPKDVHGEVGAQFSNPCTPFTIAFKT